MMKLTLPAALVRQVLSDKQMSSDFSLARCHHALDIIMADVPVFSSTTVEQLDAEIKSFMDWQKALANKSMGGVQLTAKERVVLMGLLQQGLDERHLEIERKLYDMGVVERGTEDT